METLSIIFSGSHNSGLPVFQEKDMPFEIIEVDMNVVAKLKKNWESFFPTALVMHRNVTEKSLLEEEK